MGGDSGAVARHTGHSDGAEASKALGPRSWGGSRGMMGRGGERGGSGWKGGGVVGVKDKIEGGKVKNRGEEGMGGEGGGGREQ